jgi:hypothetical protein
MESKKDAGGGM